MNDGGILKSPVRRGKSFSELDIDYCPPAAKPTRLSSAQIAELAEKLKLAIEKNKREQARGYSDATLAASGLKTNKKGEPVFPFLFSCGSCFDREFGKVVAETDDPNSKTIRRPDGIYMIEVYICEKAKSDVRLRAEGLYYLCLYFLLRSMLLAINEGTVDKYLMYRRRLEDTDIRYAKKRGKYLDEIIDVQHAIYANGEAWKIGRLVKAAWKEKSVAKYAVRDPESDYDDYSYSSSYSSSSVTDYDYHDSDGNVVATSENGTVYDADGKRIGYTDGDRLYDADDNYVGSFDDSGKLHRN